ncbi:hypothetical protein HPB48_025851 [Haemaphysalis longicornis]|uniref:Uncharacterized protein n=1 Tax=Haemaphysalis longicornis TaxID=44386 RepID=A0A9J6H898_HAELO|nr:hypothetical protein HPB48_025851 [Haemaphysalis longicornis]
MRTRFTRPAFARLLSLTFVPFPTPGAINKFLARAGPLRSQRRRAPPLCCPAQYPSLSPFAPPDFLNLPAQLKQLQKQKGLEHLQVAIDPKEIDRAHRLGRHATNRHRPIIAKFTFHKNKETVNAPKLKGTDFSIGEDFSQSVRTARRQSAGDQRAKWMRSAARQRSYYCPSRRTLEDAGTRGRHSAEKMTPSGTPIYRKCSYIEEMKNEHKNVTQNKQNGRIWSEGIASSGSTSQRSLTAFSSGETPTRQCRGIPAKSRSQTSPLLWSDDPRREKLRCSCVSVHISASAFAMSMSARIQKVALWHAGPITVSKENAFHGDYATTPALDRCDIEAAADSASILPTALRMLRLTYPATSATAYLDRINKEHPRASFSGLGGTGKEPMLIPVFIVVQLLFPVPHMTRAQQLASLGACALQHLRETSTRASGSSRDKTSAVPLGPVGRRDNEASPGGRGIFDQRREGKQKKEQGKARGTKATEGNKIKRTRETERSLCPGLVRVCARILCAFASAKKSSSQKGATEKEGDVEIPVGSSRGESGAIASGAHLPGEEGVSPREDGLQRKRALRHNSTRMRSWVQRG